jgi:uncharacterized protein
MGAAADVAPFQQFIVKLHSRCNLSCDYCYVYHHVDQSWLVLHGGEPLLAGPDVIDRVVTAVRSRVPATTEVDITLQTNGILLDDRFIDLFHRHRIGVGVSLDGGRTAHDRHRLFTNGRGSFDRVSRALRTLSRPEHRDIYTGLLCTIDLANDPIQVYEDLISFDPPQVDLLLPLGNWVHRPPRRGPDAGETPYGDWLVAVFDRWFTASPYRTGIRLFESLIALLVGGHSETEAVGLDSPYAITVETDGTLEVTDALKSTEHGKGATGYTVHRHSFDEVLAHPGVLANQRKMANLAAECRRCPLVEVCGGGQYSHRYGPDGGFDHPSVYCRDLMRLIGHIRGRLEAELSARRQRGLAA